MMAINSYAAYVSRGGKLALLLGLGTGTTTMGFGQYIASTPKNDTRDGTSYSVPTSRLSDDWETKPANDIPLPENGFYGTVRASEALEARRNARMAMAGACGLLAVGGAVACVKTKKLIPWGPMASLSAVLSSYSLAWVIMPPKPPRYDPQTDIHREAVREMKRLKKLKAATAEAAPIVVSN